jgi:hypothetical protein
VMVNEGRGCFVGTLEPEHAAIERSTAADTLDEWFIRQTFRTLISTNQPSVENGRNI